MEEDRGIFERTWKEVGYNQGCTYSARTGHTVVQYNNCVYLFGGTDKSKRQHDLYKLDLKTERWEQLVPTGEIPARRSGACGAVHEDCFYLFGGYDGRDGRYFSDLYVYNFTKNSWTEILQRSRHYTEDLREVILPTPAERTDHTMSYYNGRLYVFGGYDGKARFNDLLAFDLRRRTWTVCGEKSPFRPSKRFGHTAVVYKDGLWVFGGWDGRETLDSLWHFDFVTDSWTPICFDPDGKDGAENLTSSTKEGLVKYRKKQLSYLYSRYGIQTACKWDRGVHTNETWPENRYRHSAVVYQDQLILFGGVDKQSYRYNDLYAYNFTSGVWHKIQPFGPLPSKRTFHKAVLVQDYMYLLGGYNGKDRLKDTHKIYLGKLSPPSLQHTCAEFIRRNYSKINGFGNIPPTILDSVIWTRDPRGILRGQSSIQENLCHCLKLDVVPAVFDHDIDAEYEDQNCLSCGLPPENHVQISEDDLYEARGDSDSESSSPLLTCKLPFWSSFYKRAETKIHARSVSSRDETYSAKGGDENSARNSNVPLSDSSAGSESPKRSASRYENSRVKKKRVNETTASINYHRSSSTRAQSRGSGLPLQESPRHRSISRNRKRPIR